MTSKQLLAEFDLAFVDNEVDKLRDTAAQLAARGEYLDDVLRCVSPHTGELALAIARGLVTTDNAACLPYLDKRKAAARRRSFLNDAQFMRHKYGSV